MSTFPWSRCVSRKVWQSATSSNRTSSLIFWPLRIQISQKLWGKLIRNFISSYQKVYTIIPLNLVQICTCGSEMWSLTTIHYGGECQQGSIPKWVQLQTGWKKWSCCFANSPPAGGQVEQNFLGNGWSVSFSLSVVLDTSQHFIISINYHISEAISQEAFRTWNNL